MEDSHERDSRAFHYLGNETFALLCPWIYVRNGNLHTVAMEGSAGLLGPNENIIGGIVGQEHEAIAFAGHLHRPFHFGPVTPSLFPLETAGTSHIGGNATLSLVFRFTRVA